MGTLIDSDKVKEYLDEFEEELTNNIISIVRENYIPKADYENRLKADMVAMLDELKKEIEMMSDTVVEHRTVTITSWKGMQKRICDLVQSRIDKLKEVKDDD